MLRRALILGGLCVVVAAVGSVAWAMTSAPTTSFVACAKKKGGALRLVAVAKDCRKSERVVTWNEQGLRGLPGPRALPAKRGEMARTGSTARTASTVTMAPTEWTASMAPTPP